MKRNAEIESALELVATARDQWDHDEKLGSLWDAAHNFPEEMIEYFYRCPDQQLSIAWCLTRVRNAAVKDFFIRESRNKQPYIRSCALMNLRNYRSKDLIDIFVRGLKDRSSDVKGEALQAVKGIRDERITKALQHLSTLESFRKNSPGYYAQAQKLLRSHAKS